MNKKLPLWEKLFILPRNIRGGARRDLGAGLARFSLNQLLLLNSLYSLTRDSGGGVPLKTLAAELEVTPATASEMVDTLVRKDDLERLHSSRDRRMVLIRISPRGRIAIAKVRKHYGNVMKNFMAAMSEAEQARAAELFTRLLGDIRDYSGKMTRDDDGESG